MIVLIAFVQLLRFLLLLLGIPGGLLIAIALTPDPRALVGLGITAVSAALYMLLLLAVIHLEDAHDRRLGR